MGKKFDSFADLKGAIHKAEKRAETGPADADNSTPRNVSSPASPKAPVHTTPKPQPRNRSPRAHKSFRASPEHGRLSIYRSGSSTGDIGSKNSRSDESSHKLRIDLRMKAAGALRISGQHPVGFTPFGCLPEAKQAASVDADTVIVGLDFGTAFTKVVVSWMGDRGVVEWGRDKAGTALFWVPSTYTRGRIAPRFGNQSGIDRDDVNAIKVRLIASEAAAADDAVAYLALVLGHVIGWTQRWVSERRGAISGWALNVGFPARTLQDQAFVGLYQRIAERAWASAIGKDCTIESWKTPQISVIPEFAAQLYGYLKDPHKARDSHLLVDVGAGTVDLVAFVPHVDARGRNVSPILSSRVVTLGMHRLLAARVGAKGRELSWMESDVLRSDAELAVTCGDKEADVSNASSDFKLVLAGIVSALISGAKKNNPLCRNLEASGAIPTFLSGGGAHSTFYQHLVREADHRIRARPLPEPEDLNWSGEKSNFHRISVAYGLSFSPRNIGKIINTADLEPIAPLPTRDFGDRDDTR